MPFVISHISENCCPVSWSDGLVPSAMACFAFVGLGCGPEMLPPMRPWGTSRPCNGVQTSRPCNPWEHGGPKHPVVPGDYKQNPGSTLDKLEKHIPATLIPALFDLFDFPPKTALIWRSQNVPKTSSTCWGSTGNEFPCRSGLEGKTHISLRQKKNKERYKQNMKNARWLMTGSWILISWPIFV